MASILDNTCIVFVRDGKHFIRTPKGEEIPGLIFTRVTDDCEPGLATCILKLHVRLEEIK